MKVLFYIEPHPMRDSLFEHRGTLEVLRRLRATLPEGHEARIFCNHVLGDELLSRSALGWAELLQPGAAERARILGFAQSWFPGGMAQWCALMRDPEAEVTRFYTDLLCRLHREEYAFDAILCWGENRAVRAAAERLGVRLAFIELASFRAPFPEAYLIDPEGVNGAAAVRRQAPSAEAARAVPSEADLRRILQERFHGAALPPAAPRAADGPPTALVALQLADDANLLLYSEFATIEAYLEAAVAPLLAAGWRVALKPHPGARLRGGHVWDAQDRALRRWAGEAGVVALPEIDPLDPVARLRGVDLVVSTNSSLSFEAILCGTLGVVLGRACYALPGALPTLAEAIALDEEGRAAWRARGRVAARHMLETAFFPPDRTGGAVIAALSRRADGGPT